MDKRPILIVDDYAGARYLRSRLLNDAGYEVLEASGGEEALRIVAEAHPALVLLDVNLPDISGTEVCRRLKQDPQTARIPVIQITGAWLSDQARQQGIASGADQYLTEPVDEMTLLRHIVALLDASPQSSG
jgi:two-component system, sensor histidine kinase